MVSGGGVRDGLRDQRWPQGGQEGWPQEGREWPQWVTGGLRGDQEGLGERREGLGDHWVGMGDRWESLGDG